MVYTEGNCYTSKDMCRRRSLLTSVFSLLIAAGVLCAQVCDISCAIRACSFKTPDAQATHLEKHAPACHHQDNRAQSESQSGPDHNSPDCRMHTDVVVALPHHSDTLAATHHLPQPPVAALPVPVSLLAGNRPFSESAQRCFRPPPRQSSITILRV